MVSQPQYLLFCDAKLSATSCSNESEDHLIGAGRWFFVLERLDSKERLEAMDAEPQIHRDRIGLLAVIRGLEAIEQPGHVRLVTTSRYVDRGIRFGLPNWRDSNYLWESFGSFRPIRNADLWRRVAHAMEYHEVSCRVQNSLQQQFGGLLHSPLNAWANRLDTPPRNRRVIRPSSSKRQWWEMAAACIQSVRESTALPADLSLAPN